MDTGTHLVMGVTLGGLATLSPEVSHDPKLSTTLLVTTIIGSQLPDIDTILKLRNNAKYIKHHRGITHSIPAVITWTILLSVCMSLIENRSNFGFYLFWSFLAVSVHVYVDLFNAYGTQALRPISKRWIAFGIISTFDPIIFAMHAIGVPFVLFHIFPGAVCVMIYIIMIIYYMFRLYEKRKVIQLVKKQIDHVDHVFIMPSLKYTHYHIVATTKTHHHVGKMKFRKLKIHDVFERTPLPVNDDIKAALKDENIKSFLAFSPVYIWRFSSVKGYNELRLIDLRYKTETYYPFVAVAKFDDSHHIISSFTGWIFSERKLQKKLVTEK
ncbi:metal-dependent hydrolase [Bacillus sp. RG28]|uniref:Metal-dependent hydrolase n=1 Tax=Gottfriedia endophytica TaxID=2820819 RepID=A0A940SMB4_9BACI|nr:metal-dependent hydrolase [Gottfriedia endophytica]MBP0727188.1 metal-dependent hydrolase [Gottfriedia endophytica]